MRDEFQYLKKKSGCPQKVCPSSIWNIASARREVLPGSKSPDDLVTAHAKRIGIEKRGDSFALFVSINGKPMHYFGAPIQLHLDEPFYMGIGFCSHLPDKADTAVLSNVGLVNAAGEVR